MSKIATSKLWYNADKTRLVKDGDPEARFLAAAVGDEIPDIGKASATDVEEDDDDVKQAPKPANKQAAKAANK